MRSALVLLSLCLVGGSATRADGWRLAEAADLPDWLELFGHVQARFETLDGQFRSGLAGGDQVLAVRTLMHGRARAGGVTFGLEVSDSRTALDDDGTALNTTLVNPADVLQAYLDIRTGPGEANGLLRVGRITIDLGSRRWVGRQIFRNTIQPFSGAHWRSRPGQRGRLELLLVAPVRIEPVDRRGQGDNDLQSDVDEFNRRFGAVHYTHFGDDPRTRIELFVYGLHEEDRVDRPTPNQRFVFPGVRLYATPAAGRFDYDVEASYRLGKRRLTRAPDDRRDLDLKAYAWHGEVGYSFGTQGRTRLSLNYDEASGDGDPNDDRYERWDQLFAPRRPDLGNTSLFGPLDRANLRAPGLRAQWRVNPRFDAQADYKAAFLADDQDRIRVPRLQDPSGDAGDFVGHQLEGRVRYWLIPDTLRAEFGASALLAEEFLETAPGATGNDQTLFGFAQLTAYF